MRYETSQAFEADLRKLTVEERRLFRDVVLTAFGPGCDAHVGAPGARWPTRLRVKPLRGAPGVFEMTWSVAGPDGRATWDRHRLASGDPCIRWRRIGGNAIFGQP